MRNGVSLGVADAKYKPRISSEDRYELLAFCEATGVVSGAFIAPIFGDEPGSDLHGTTLGGKTLYVVRVNLAAADMVAEEEKFLSNLSAVLGL